MDSFRVRPSHLDGKIRGSGQELCNGTHSLDRHDRMDCSPAAQKSDEGAVSFAVGFNGLVGGACSAEWFVPRSSRISGGLGMECAKIRHVGRCQR